MPWRGSADGKVAMTAPIAVGAADAADADALARLAHEMGYQVSPAVMTERLGSLPKDHEVFVATVDGQVVGWVHLYVNHTLLVEPRAELGGIAVGSNWRRRGVGRHLMNWAEQWASQRGCKVVYVRSGSERTDAHGFYRRLGYQELKTQSVFTKDLS